MLIPNFNKFIETLLEGGRGDPHTLQFLATPRLVSSKKNNKHA